MRFQIPVVLPYAVGFMLVVFGALRALYLGWRRKDREIVEEEAGPRKKGPRYHLAVGILWVVMGLFLVISTYYQTRH
jgi:uncharacterized membrane protein HdeD (DUF308 family)